MRALTIQQPYAHLVVHHQSELPDGTVQKLIENRTRKTNIRGQIAIHAGLSMKWFRFGDWSTFPKRQTHVPEITFGAIIGLADIVDCLSAESDKGKAWQRQHEHAVGPFMYVLANVFRLVTPVPAKGALGFWTVPEEIRQQVEHSEKILIYPEM